MNSLCTYVLHILIKNLYFYKLKFYTLEEHIEYRIKTISEFAVQ